MAKVAKIVLVSLMTRVIVEDTATDEEIVEASKKNFRDKINDELHENLEEIYDDKEVPYVESPNDLDLDGN